MNLRAAWRMRREGWAAVIANLLPARVVYHTCIRAAAHATTGPYGTTVVPEVPAMTVLQRWEHDMRLSPRLT